MSLLIFFIKLFPFGWEKTIILLQVLTKEHNYILQILRAFNMSRLLVEAHKKTLK